jgi:hypothetical protein
MTCDIIYTIKHICKYHAIDNYLDQRRLWILKRTSKSTLSDALDARKYFRLHIPVLNLGIFTETRPNRQQHCT